MDIAESRRGTAHEDMPIVYIHHLHSQRSFLRRRKISRVAALKTNSDQRAALQEIGDDHPAKHQGLV